ncbi:MAG TPA: serine hydrolase, partial [Salinivirgaceae bacterium]|nr:serine hydrolase [Salinivirgaceae bacterium]
RIAPTENDTIFRKQLIHGYVHDQGAALLGGKSGHAGLFGNALEIAIFGQMLLNNGEYGNKKYFDKKTIDLFTTAHFTKDKNRRGLGFDKPDINKSTLGPTFSKISQSSFGHTGFTGTYLWIDPEEQIVYVFLSNRIYPDASNKKLSKYNIRTRVHSKFYEAFIKNSQFSISDNEIQ